MRSANSPSAWKQPARRAQVGPDAGAGAAVPFAPPGRPGDREAPESRQRARPGRGAAAEPLGRPRDRPRRPGSGCGPAPSNRPGRTGTGRAVRQAPGPLQQVLGLSRPRPRPGPPPRGDPRLGRGGAVARRPPRACLAAGARRSPFWRGRDVPFPARLAPEPVPAQGPRPAERTSVGADRLRGQPGQRRSGQRWWRGVLGGQSGRRRGQLPGYPGCQCGQPTSWLGGEWHGGCGWFPAELAQLDRERDHRRAHLLPADHHRHDGNKHRHDGKGHRRVEPGIHRGKQRWNRRQQRQRNPRDQRDPRSEWGEWGEWGEWDRRERCSWWGWWGGAERGRPPAAAPGRQRQPGPARRPAGPSQRRPGAVRARR